MKSVVLVVIVGLSVILGCGGKATLEKTPEVVSLVYKDLGGEYVQYKASSSVTFNYAGTVRSWLSDITYSVRIDSIAADGTIDRRMKFDDFVMGEISGGRLNLDPDADKYKGEALWLKLGGDGELIDWKGLEGIRGYTPEDRDLKHVLVQQMATLFQPLGQGEVGQGSRWQGTVEIPLKIRGGEFTQTVTTDYEIVGFARRLGRDCAKIKITLTLEGEGSGTRGADRKFWVDSVGDGEGEVWFDYVNGLVVEYVAAVTATQDFSYERAGKEDVKTEFATIDSESKIKLVE